MKNKINYSFLNILTGSDLSSRRLPVMEIKSSKPGPTVWLTACVHGDEVGGMVVVHELFKKLKQKPLLRGRIFALPLMNPLGFEISSRNINLSHEDLNRSFPGNSRGTLAERIADRIYSTIIAAKPDLVLDLHNDWLKSVPHCFIDPDNSGAHRQAYQKSKGFGFDSGFLLIEDAASDVRGTLSYSLLERNIPALSLELGEAYSVNEKNVADGVKSIWNILFDLKMTAAPIAGFNYQTPKELKNILLKYSHQLVSSASGILRFLAQPGELVKRGQTVAYVYDAFGKLEETIKSNHSGVILGLPDYAVAFPGAPVASFGVIK